jgi:hypothetical protein
MLRTLTTTACLVIAATGVGCGSSGPSNTGNRPPVTDYIGVLLDGKTTTISRNEIGGGPVTFKITNQSRLPISSVIVRSRYGAQGCVDTEARAKDIPAGGTGTLKATLIEGSCEVVADRSTAATLLVGPERPSAQNKLLLP